MIEITNLSKYINDNTIVKDVNLSINDGTKLGIVGKSGAGKSSLVRMINYLMRPSEGKVIVDGQDLSKLKNKELQIIRKDIGMVFQQFNLLQQKNVYNNIKLSLDVVGYDSDKKEDRINELLKLVGLTSKRNDYPKTLSGGEQQRVAIARALANNPKYLLCDEPTSALDATTSYEILDLLHKINSLYNTTIVFVSHDLDAVKYLCNEVAVMLDGEIVEYQPTKELFLSPKSSYTKQLINKKMFDLSLNSKEEIYQITYLNEDANEPILFDIAKIFNVEINIIYAEVININKINIGFLYVNIIGNDKLKAINSLKKKVRIDKYV